MAREWQQTRFKEFVMPEAVYYQSIWAVRDLERLEERLRELNSDIKDGPRGTSLVSDGRTDYDKVKPTESRAIEKMIVEERIKGIRKALNLVPEGYRSYILSNIILKNPGTSFPNKMWRIWKQRFLFNVAKNLALM